MEWGTMANPTLAATPYLAIQQIQDQYIRTNFQNLVDYFKSQNQFLDFQFFELVFTAAATGYKQAHGLAYIPLDILVSHLSGAGAVTFQYGSFDSTFLVLDVSGPCRIRFFAGTCSKVISSVTAAATDAQKFSSGVP